MVADIIETLGNKCGKNNSPDYKKTQYYQNLWHTVEFPAKLLFLTDIRKFQYMFYGINSHFYGKID